MGCGPSDNMQPGANSLRIWGDYFNQDTRALLAICEMAGAEIDFVKIDTLTKENMQESYMELNPNSTIPMLTHGNTKVIGDGPAMFNYLVNSTERVAEHFSHEA